MRKRMPLPELQRIYVKPLLDRRQREAMSAWFVATCSGEKKRPHPDTVDPMWLRWGMRASNIHQRAGWVVSSPQYSDSLDRHPENDPSLPGPGWLREVYVLRDGRELCVLPGVRAFIEARREARRAAERWTPDDPRLAVTVSQPDLFGQPERALADELAPVFPKAPAITEADIPY